jgi:hypothetical protein
MVNQTKTSPRSWLAFELNVLRRLKFASAALPFTNEPLLGSYVKRWGMRVMANDPLQSAWIKSVAIILNNGEKLSAEDVNIVLEDAYVPGFRLQNPALRQWFSETDSWWFDNVKRNIDRLQTPVTRAIASSIALAVGDYVLSFTPETLELRQSLSNVFRRLWTLQPDPVNNGQNNTCSNKNANEFLAESFVDMLFLQLPQSHALNKRISLGHAAWREEWLRGGSDFWDDLESAQSGRLGTSTETKSQYLHLVEETLQTAAHIKSWAISHVEDGFITTQDIVETIGKIRRVDTIFTKDFSELTGTKAAIITA